MAELGKLSGMVTAIVSDRELAVRTATNFSQTPNVRSVQGDGARVPFDRADVIYVNAGATHPAAAWLDRLKDDGG